MFSEESSSQARMMHTPLPLGIRAIRFDLRSGRGKEEIRKRKGGGERKAYTTESKKGNLGDTGSLMFRGRPETGEPFSDPSGRKCGRVPRQDVFRCSFPTKHYPEHNYSITITITVAINATVTISVTTPLRLPEF